MSELELEKKGYCEDTLEMEQGARLIYLMLGERLSKIRDSKMYEPYWSSWHEYCMEFKDLSTGSISKIITVYKKFVVELGYKPSDLAKAGGWTKLYEISKRVDDKKDAEKWLGLAETCSRKDLNDYLIEDEVGVEMSECKHTDTYVIRVCRECGNKEEVYE